MSMATAAVSRHSTIAGALDSLAALAGTEGTTMIDAIVRTYLTGVKSVGTALNLSVIDIDC